jgi:hypothetical protein
VWGRPGRGLGWAGLGWRAELPAGRHSPMPPGQALAGARGQRVERAPAHPRLPAACPHRCRLPTPECITIADSDEEAADDDLAAGAGGDQARGGRRLPGGLAHSDVQRLLASAQEVVNHEQYQGAGGVPPFVCARRFVPDGMSVADVAEGAASTSAAGGRAAGAAGGPAARAAAAHTWHRATSPCARLRIGASAKLLGCPGLRAAQSLESKMYWGVQVLQRALPRSGPAAPPRAPRARWTCWTSSSSGPLWRGEQ